MKIPLHQKPFYNDLVEQAFAAMLDSARELLAEVKRDDLRLYFERRAETKTSAIRHEIISPLLYLRLEREDDGVLAIRFGIEPIRDDMTLQNITAQFLRAVFSYTSKDCYDMNIEGCIRTDWFINCCNDVYEYVDMNTMYHRIVKVPYRKPVARRKPVLNAM